MHPSGICDDGAAKSLVDVFNSHLPRLSETSTARRRSHGHLIQHNHNPCNIGFALSLISQLYLRDHSNSEGDPVQSAFSSLQAELFALWLAKSAYGLIMTGKMPVSAD
ncbi:hypothetical protein HDV63DRAFT_246559 [Trichoderma sp. SZMC 28014]